MKNLNIYILFFFIISCSKDDKIDFDTTAQENLEIEIGQDNEPPLNIPVFSTNELIVQYKDGISPTEKDAIRAANSIDIFETCNCSDQSIEKWMFDDGIDIEARKRTLTSTGEGGVEEIKNIDTEFSFKREVETDSISGNTTQGDYQNYIGGNHGVTIAVLDTGVNVSYPGFLPDFLYNAYGFPYGNNGPGSLNQISGWDYVNEDDNTQDDYNKIHGTKVSYILHEKLNNEGVPHQILPIKIADNTGKISAFNLICGLKNAAELAHIVNISAGYYTNTRDERSTIMEDLIDINSHVLFVTSAGNSAVDTDDNFHYPSSCTNDNVLSIAAATAAGDRKASFSNYGIESVDFYAIGDRVEFVDFNATTVYLSGTSFAAPYVTAVSAKILFNSGITFQPTRIIQELDAIGTHIDGEDAQKVKYGKIIE